MSDTLKRKPIPHTNLDHVRWFEQTEERRSDPNASWGPVSKPGFRPLEDATFRCRRNLGDARHQYTTVTEQEMDALNSTERIRKTRGHGINE